MNALGVNEVDNEVLNDADQYLREHKILELFEVRNSLPIKTMPPEFFLALSQFVLN